MAEAITTFEELQNCLILGLDFWVVVVSANYPKRISEPFLLKNARLEQGARGTKLGNGFIASEYLVRWGIKDSDNDSSVRTYSFSTMMLFHSKHEADSYKEAMNGKSS